MSPQVLLVEDNDGLILGLAVHLERAGFSVSTVRLDENLLASAAALNPKLIILDLSLPEMDGFVILEKLRRTGRSFSVMVLSGVTDEEARVMAFRLGAVDYVAKPFSVREVLERVRLRSGYEEPSLCGQRIHLVPERQEVNIRGGGVKLAPKEYSLLAQLMAHPDVLQTRQELLAAVWNIEIDIATKTVDFHIKRLRDKLRPFGANGRILTIAKRGFLWQAER